LLFKKQNKKIPLKQVSFTYLLKKGFATMPFQVQVVASLRHNENGVGEKREREEGGVRFQD